MSADLPPSDALNVLGGPLLACSYDPLTGWMRTGCCEADAQDIGRHHVCVKVTEAFLDFSKLRGNDLSTPRPEYRFAGLKPGDRWCLCALRWREAWEEGVAPPVVLAATHMAALEVIPFSALKRHGVTTMQAEDEIAGIGMAPLGAIGRKVAGLKPFPPLSGPGVDIPSTPFALWLWLRGDDRGELLHRARHIETALAPAFTLADSWDAFKHDGGRDLSGYEDGTENPTEEAAIEAGAPLPEHSGLIHAFKHMLKQEIDPAFKAMLLRAPATAELWEGADNINPLHYHEAREALLDAIAKACLENLVYIRTWALAQEEASGLAAPYEYHPGLAGVRALLAATRLYTIREERHGMMEMAAYSGEQAASHEKTVCARLQDYITRYEQLTPNMTHEMSVLNTVNHLEESGRNHLLNQFAERYADDALVMDKYFILIGASHRADTLEQVQSALHHPKFNLENPNKCVPRAENTLRTMKNNLLESCQPCSQGSISAAC